MSKTWINWEKHKLETIILRLEKIVLSLEDKKWLTHINFKKKKNINVATTFKSLVIFIGYLLPKVFLPML